MPNIGLSYLIVFCDPDDSDRQDGAQVPWGWDASFSPYHLTQVEFTQRRYLPRR